MQGIPLQPIPNQSFTLFLDNNRWEVGVRTTNGCVCVSLSLNGVVVIENLRAVANTRIIPAEYQESGNFAILTQRQELPEYTQFGIGQTMVYISQAELEVVRAPHPSPVTASFFDALGALPLRFAPQNYTLAP